MTGSLPPSARVLARAAMDLDSDLVSGIVRRSIGELGVPATWDQLVRPVWLYLGSGPEGVSVPPAVEHFFVRSAFRALATAWRPEHDNRAWPA
jgi:MerR family transcriptional regulator, light-induced transcriptional regulator